MRTLLLVGLCLLWGVNAALAGSGGCPQSWFGGTAVPEGSTSVRQLLEWNPRGGEGQSLLVVATGLESSSRGAVYAWNGEGWLDLTGPLDGSVEAACVFESDLVVVGTFRNIGGIAASGVARFDGVRWTALAATPSLRVIGAYSVVEHEGDLVVAGVLQFPNQVTVQRVARYRAGEWHAMTDGDSSRYPRFLVTHKGDLYKLAYTGINNFTDLSRWDGTRWILIESIDNFVWDAASLGDDLVISTERAAQFGDALTAVAAWNGNGWRSLADPSEVVQGFSLFVFRGALHAHLYRSQRRTISRLDNGTWKDLHSGPTEGYLRSFVDLHEWRGELVALSAGESPMTVSIVRNGTLVPVTFAPYPVKELAFADADADGAFLVVPNPAGAGFVSQLWDGKQARVLGAAFNAAPAVFLRDGDTMYAGGSFTKIGDTTALAIARFDGNSWQPMTNALQFGVLALCNYRGSLFAAGTFRSTAGTVLSRVARWDGTAWASPGLGVGIVTSGGVRVNAMCVYEDRLIVAGTFTVASGAPVSNVASWNGEHWTAMGELPSSVSHLFVHRGVLIAAKKSTSGPSVYRWDGSQWTAIAMSIRSITGAAVHQDKIAFITDTGLGFLNDPSGSDAEFYPVKLSDPFTNSTSLAISVNNKLQIFKGGSFIDGLLVPDFIEWSDVRPPVVLRDPVATHACAGRDAVMRAGFVSAEPLAFHWEKDGVPLEDSVHFGGTNTQELRLLDARRSMSGSYRCIASGACVETPTAATTFSVCYADFNCDGLVESQDFELFVVAYDEVLVPPAEARFDINEDGVVDDIDFQLFIHAYNACMCDGSAPGV